MNSKNWEEHWFTCGALIVKKGCEISVSKAIINMLERNCPSEIGWSWKIMKKVRALAGKMSYDKHVAIETSFSWLPSQIPCKLKDVRNFCSS